MSEKVSKKKRVDREKAIEKLWHMGELSWKLKGKQIKIYNHFNDSPDDITTCLISRQFGKSFTLCLMAVEMCLSKPNAIVKYVCPTSKMVINVMVPRVRDVIADCPEELKPHWYPSEKKWKFPNGSEIQVAGTENGSYDSIRGGSSDMCVADEAGFMTDLETVILNVLAPTTDTTGGKIFLASTPNDKDPNHMFHDKFVYPSEALGRLLKMTYEDSPLVDDVQKARIIARYPGGVKNIRFRCEYLCEIPDVTESTVVPEFRDNEKDIVQEVDRPDYCDFYTSLDVGFKDLTAALFGYWDYKHARLVIMDEYVINGPDMLLKTLAKEIKHMESIYFVDSVGLQHEPTLRIMDNDLIICNDLSISHGIPFRPTAKHNKEGAVDTVRMWADTGKLIIHPRCKHLLYHLKYAQWHVNKTGKITNTFKHLKDVRNGSEIIQGGHVDTLDALIYMARNVIDNNPYPDNYGSLQGNNVFTSPNGNKPEQTRLQGIMDVIMGRKGK